MNDHEFAEVEVAAVPAVVVPGQAKADMSDMKRSIEDGFGAAMNTIMQQGLAPAGQPRVVYTGFGADGVSLQMVVPVAQGGETVEGGKFYRFTHHGSYANLRDTYNGITAYLGSRGLLRSEADWARYMPMWEEYCNDPRTTPENDLLTYIYLPVAAAAAA